MGEFVDGVLTRLQEQFQLDSIAEALGVLAASLVVGMAVFAAFYLVWRLLDLVLRSIIKRSSRIDETSASFLKTALKFLVLTLGVVQALAATGIDTGAVVASLGLAGLTIGFAARDALSNLISGILIFWDRPFVIGDLVEVEGHYGRVDQITLRSTRVVTVDGKMLAVPNTTIINSTVTSYTNFPHLRLDVAVTVDVSENLDHVRRILLALVRKQDGFMTEPPPRMVVTALNDYNTEVMLQAWIEDEREHIKMRFELRERIFEALNEAGINMPYETIQLAPVEVRQVG
ncbi:MAG: mechanosensitive ion channel family protein [Rhodothermales bacterium]|nr:mechanosensitive ion channel family protein [Rhodothermales bacterium]MBO6780765.1 mechanosensitive ion channel family protein [Rhodothermales bacterium]